MPEIIPNEKMIGKRFDMLTVVEYLGYVSTGKSSKKMWRCKCDCGKFRDVSDATLKRPSKTYKSCGCLSGIKSIRKPTDWDHLYQFVRKEILGYDRQGLDEKMVLLLVGLRKGQYIANNQQMVAADYSDDVILKTFISCKPKIEYAIKTKNFATDYNKLSYACAIVRKNLATVYIAIKEHERLMQSMSMTSGKHETYEEQLDRFNRAHPQEKRKIKKKTGVFEDAF